MFETGLFELMSVNNSARTEDTIGIVFSSFSNMKLCCLFSLESHRSCDSNEYKQHITILFIILFIKSRGC